MNPDDPRMRFRFWTDGKLVDETWVDASNPDSVEHFEALADRYEAFADTANFFDRLWLAEMYDPAEPEHRAYTRRGTDTRGMIDPRPLT